MEIVKGVHNHASLFSVQDQEDGEALWDMGQGEFEMGKREEGPILNEPEVFDLGKEIEERYKEEGEGDEEGEEVK